MLTYDENPVIAVGGVKIEFETQPWNEGEERTKKYKSAGNQFCQQFRIDG